MHENGMRETSFKFKFGTPTPPLVTEDGRTVTVFNYNYQSFLKTILNCNDCILLIKGRVSHWRQQNNSQGALGWQQRSHNDLRDERRRVHHGKLRLISYYLIPLAPAYLFYIKSQFIVLIIFYIQTCSYGGVNAVRKYKRE